MKVIGVGDNVVDKYVHRSIMYPGGNALNFSVYAKYLGVESAYLGVFGSDKAAQHIIDVLTRLGVDISRCRHAAGENGYAAVTIEDGERVFLGSNSGGVLKEYGLELNGEDLGWIKNYDLVHSSCYSRIEKQLKKIKEIGVPISFDFSDDFCDAYLEKICPDLDFSFLSCSHLGEKVATEMLKKVFDLGCQIVVATLGSKGAILYDGNNFYHQEPNLVEAVDTLGAGDAMITAFLLHYLEHCHDDGVNMREVIEQGLKKGAGYAAQICLVEGAFEYGLAY